MREPLRHSLPLACLLILSVTLHIGLFLCWPIPENSTFPDVGPKQLTLEIKHNQPPGEISTPPIDTIPSRPPRTRTNEMLATPSSLDGAVHTTELVITKQHDSSQTEQPSQDTRQHQILTSAQIEEKLHGRLKQALLPYFTYPAVARRRGWEGTVKISLRIENDGRLTNLKVVKSSKFNTLNRAALHSLHQISGIPEAKLWLAGRHMDMVIPIEYSLLDS